MAASSQRAASSEWAHAATTIERILITQRKQSQLGTCRGPTGGKGKARSWTHKARVRETAWPWLFCPHTEQQTGFKTTHGTRRKANDINSQEATSKCSSAHIYYFYTCTVKEEVRTLRISVRELGCIPSVALSSFWSVSRVERRYMGKAFKHDSGTRISQSYKVLLSEALLPNHRPAADLEYIRKCTNTWRRRRDIHSYRCTHIQM